MSMIIATLIMFVDIVALVSVITTFRNNENKISTLQGVFISFLVSISIIIKSLSLPLKLLDSKYSWQ